jgi:hypothetical protein
MTETLITLLTWLIPSGGVGAVAAWLTSRKLRTVRTDKEIHDTYKIMYDDVQQTLVAIRKENRELYDAQNNQREENEKLRIAIESLERTIAQAANCRHWDVCPIRHELPERKADLRGTRRGSKSDQPGGQPKRSGHAPRDGTREERHCGTATVDDEPH